MTGRQQRPLARRFPALAGIPLLPLASLPTPVEELDLSPIVSGFRGRAWVKREDRSADALGGNKVRKLEYLLADARARGSRRLVTIGGIGSNHCLATAYYAPEASCEVDLVLFPHDLSPSTRRTLRAICALGPRILVAGTDNRAAVRAAAHALRLQATGRRPYVLPPGGSTVTGALGFVDAGLELAEQVRDGHLEEPEALFCAYSSGGTAAGLAVGLQLGGLRTDVVAVRVYPPPLTSAVVVRRYAQRIHRRLEREGAAGLPPFDASRLRAPGGHLGEGYAVPSEEGSAAREAASALGLELEPTYTAKAFAAFLDAAASRRYREGRLLFLQTYDARVPPGLDEPPPAHLVPKPLRPYV